MTTKDIIGSILFLILLSGFVYLGYQVLKGMKNHNKDK